MLEAQPLWRSQLCEFIGLDEETLNVRICHRKQSVSHSHNETVVTLQLSLRKMANVFAGNTCSLFIFSNPTVVVRIIGTLGKYDQRRLWKLICIVNYFDYLPFRSEDWNGHSRSLVLCSVTHFCVVFVVWIIVQLEDSNMAHYKISVSHLQGCEVTNYKYSRYSN